MCYITNQVTTPLNVSCLGFCSCTLVILKFGSFSISTYVCFQVLMRRRSTRARMGLRGRSGVLAYMMFGTAVLVAVYYVWNNFFFTASSKITYSSVQGLKPDHVALWDKQKQQGFVMEEPPIGLSKEIEIQVQCLFRRLKSRYSVYSGD